VVVGKRERDNKQLFVHRGKPTVQRVNIHRHILDLQPVNVPRKDRHELGLQVYFCIQGSERPLVKVPGEGILVVRARLPGDVQLLVEPIPPVRSVAGRVLEHVDICPVGGGAGCSVVGVLETAPGEDGEVLVEVREQALRWVVFILGCQRRVLGMSVLFGVQA